MLGSGKTLLSNTLRLEPHNGLCSMLTLPSSSKVWKISSLLKIVCNPRLYWSVRLRSRMKTSNRMHQTSRLIKLLIALRIYGVVMTKHHLLTVHTDRFSDRIVTCALEVTVKDVMYSTYGIWRTIITEFIPRGTCALPTNSLNGFTLKSWTTLLASECVWRWRRLAPGLSCYSKTLNCVVQLSTT